MQNQENPTLLKTELHAPQINGDTLTILTATLTIVFFVAVSLSGECCSDTNI